MTTDGLIIGIDLGGTNMQVGVVDGQQVLSRIKKKTRATEGQETVINRIAEAARLAVDEAGVAFESIVALGIVAPGAIDVPRGIVLEAPNLGWIDTPLRDELAARLNCPVVLDNDVNGAIWGEYMCGAGRGTGDVLGVWIGTGVGGGLVLNGALYHGDGWTAGEIGRTIIDPEGEPGSQLVEDFCSRTGMSRIIQRNLPAYPDSVLHDLTDSKGRVTGSKKLAEAFRQDDELAVSIVERAAFLLGLTIANHATVLSLQHVIIGGGVAEALGAPFVELIQQSFKTHVFPDRLQSCEFALTQLEADAGVLGAAMIAREGISVQV